MIKIEDRIDNAIKNKTYSIKNEKEYAFCTNTYHRRMFFKCAVRGSVLSDYTLFFWSHWLRCEVNMSIKALGVQTIIGHPLFAGGEDRISEINISGRLRGKIIRLYQSTIGLRDPITHKKILNDILKELIGACWRNLLEGTVHVHNMTNDKLYSLDAYDSLGKTLRTNLLRGGPWKNKQINADMKKFNPFQKGSTHYKDIANAYFVMFQTDRNLPLNQLFYLVRGGETFDRISKDYVPISYKEPLTEDKAN